MNNSFLNQFSENIKFKYFCFDRVIIRGYILCLFFPAGVVRLLRALGFTRLSNGVMRILTDLPAVLKAQLLQAGQLNAHIQKVARNKELLKPKYHAYGFRTVDLLKNLPQFFQNPAQIRYEMNKLRVRGIVEKNKGMSFYRVTGTGWKWLWISICSERYFKNPIISMGSKKTPSFSADQPSKIEAAYSMLNQGLSVLTQELALIS